MQVAIDYGSKSVSNSALLASSILNKIGGCLRSMYAKYIVGEVGREYEANIY